MNEEIHPKGTLIHYQLPFDMHIPDGWRIYAHQPNLFNWLDEDPLNPYQPDDIRSVILEKK